MLQPSRYWSASSTVDFNLLLAILKTINLSRVDLSLSLPVVDLNSLRSVTCRMWSYLYFFFMYWWNIFTHFFLSSFCIELLNQYCIPFENMDWFCYGHIERRPAIGFGMDKELLLNALKSHL